MNGAASPLPMPWLGLALFLIALAVQRVSELVVSARHTRALFARGARESGAGHFPLIVAVHVLFPLALVAEVVFAGARPGSGWPWWLALWLGAQILRYVAIRTLGSRWSVRILTLRGESRVRRGIYRLIPHPNYLAVVVELIAAPMMFGAWRTAIAIGLLDAVALTVRIRAEERALDRDG